MAETILPPEVNLDVAQIIQSLIYGQCSPLEISFENTAAESAFLDKMRNYELMTATPVCP